SLIRIKFSDDDRFLAMLVGEPDHNDETGTVLYNSGTWDIYGTFWGHEYGVEYCAFSPDGTKMATCDRSRYVKIWNIEERKLFTEIMTKYGFVHSVIFTDDEYVIASTGGALPYINIEGRKISDNALVFSINNYYSYTMDYNHIVNKICGDFSGTSITDMGYVLLINPDVSSSVNEPIKQSITASPNPANNSIKISFSLPNSGLTNVEICDLNSKIIRKLHTGFLESGQHSFDWGTKAIPAGVYFCKISSKEFNESVKIIVEK
ncbi:MAG: hypothetical protein CVV22_04680, partial [Ignavibacteriae bacterium HGW-Ignavibacteriae-1]